jgi:hypothetical protein
MEDELAKLAACLVFVGRIDATGGRSKPRNYRGERNRRTLVEAKGELGHDTDNYVGQGLEPELPLIEPYVVSSEPGLKDVLIEN